MKTIIKRPDLEILELNEKEALWYGRKEAKYIVRFTNNPEWTKDALIVNGRFSDNHKTGFLVGNGNTATHSAIYTKVDHLIN